MTHALLLVAHPDDEVIFAGGLMLSHPDWSWHVACATYPANHVRGKRLRKSIHEFGKRGVQIAGLDHLGIEDNGVTVFSLDTFSGFKQSLERYEPDIVFTHNRLGEYGHPHHMACNAAAKAVLSRRAPIWSFYANCESSVGSQEKGTFAHRIDLTGGLDIPKRTIMLAAYPEETDAISRDQPSLLVSSFEEECFISDTGGWPS